MAKRNQMPRDNASPEATGVYQCPNCPEQKHFVGYDDHGYPGDACTCGAVYQTIRGASNPLCVCDVTLRQPFRVDPIDYEAFTGGGRNAQISAYDRIECANCQTQIWPEVKRG